MKKAFKTYYWLLFLLIPMTFIVVYNVKPDNDIWFLLGNGRYIIKHGIPHIDPFTIHEGLDYIMQQWLSSAIMWKIYSWFGKRGILFFVMIISVALIGIYYKICKLISNNKNVSLIITIIVFIPMFYFVVSRPQILTYLFLLIEILLLELYIKNDNAKYLIGLPILSLLEINFHSTMWPFLFIVILPYLLNCIRIKNITVDKIRWKPLVIVLILMILVGFINPYGYENMLVIFNSYGSKTINIGIMEMQYLNVGTNLGKIALLFLIGYFCLTSLIKGKKLDIRHICLLSGFTILAFLHNKGLAYFLLALGIVSAYQFGNVDIEKFIKKIFGKYRKILFNLMPVMSLFVLVTFSYALFLSCKYYTWSTFSSNFEAANYIIENSDLENVRLYTQFEHGGFFEYMGIKCYIDGRAELFLKKFNHKKDILDENYELENNRNFDLESFLNEYHFTHLFVSTNSLLHDYLNKNDNYKVVYNEWFDTEKTYAIRKLFIYVGD